MNAIYQECVDAKIERKKILSQLTGRPEEEKTFDRDDRLGLRPYGENIISLIRKSIILPRSNDNRSYVIGIDGSWGSGKTTFLSMLYSELVKNAGQGDEPVLPIYYNAWRGDFWNNAFAPFFDCIWNSIPGWKDAFKLEDIVTKWHIIPTVVEEAAFDSASQRECESIENISADAIRAASWTLAACLAKPATALMDSEFRKKADKYLSKVYSEAVREEKETEDFFNEYSSFQQSIHVLQEFLENLTGADLEENAIVEQEEAVERRTVAIFVDELDRCRPDFAVQTLEIIKHMFNVKRVVFVIAMDIGQLSHTVKNVYGEGFESVGYLERFFNVMMILPQGTQLSYERVLDDVQNEIMNIEEDSQDRLDDKKCLIEEYKWDSIKKDISFIAKNFSLSLREYRRILLNMHLLETTSVLRPYLTYKTARVMYFYCLVIKYKFPLEFAHAVFTRDVTSLDMKVPKHQSEEMQYLKSIRSMIMMGAKSTIGSIDYTRYYSTGKEIGSLEWGFPEPAKWYDEEDLVSNICYSYVLYPPDRIIKEKIKDYTLLEYIYRKLEMFDMSMSGRVEEI